MSLGGELYLEWKISIYNAGAIFEISTFITPLSPNYLEKMVSLWKKCSKITFWDHDFFFYLIQISLLSAHHPGCPRGSMIKWVVSINYSKLHDAIWYYLSTFNHKITITPIMTDFEVFESPLYFKRIRQYMT